MAQKGGVRGRLQREYDEAVRRLRDLGIAPRAEEVEPREVGSAIVDHGDMAQASERQDMSFATRQRLAARINQLAAALRRIEDGTHGKCSVCGEAIEAARLRAMPEADTCLRCQEARERSRGRHVA